MLYLIEIHKQILYIYILSMIRISDVPIPEFLDLPPPPKLLEPLVSNLRITKVMNCEFPFSKTSS